MNDDTELKIKKALALQAELIRLLNLAVEKGVQINDILGRISIDESGQGQDFSTWVEKNMKR